MRWNLMDNAITDSDKLELVKFILNSDRYTTDQRFVSLKQNGRSGWDRNTL